METQHMNELLEMLSEEELRFFTQKCKEVFDNGFGSVTIVVKNGHADAVKLSQSIKFPKPAREDYRAE